MISVIMPVYKAEKYLERSITSVLNQIHTDFELLLIDDGSPDNSGALCDEWAKKDGRIKVFHKPNGGTSSARNLGIENAQGEYIAFIDSDDIVKPEWLSDMYAVAAKTGADLVKSGFSRFEETTQPDEPCNMNIVIKSSVHFEAEQISTYEFHCRLANVLGYRSVCNQLIKSEIQKKCLFAVGNRYEDYRAFFSILEYAENIHITNSSCYCWGDHVGSVSNTLSNSYIADCVDNHADHCRIFTLKYNDKKNSAYTLNMAMVFFFYHLVGVERISTADYTRVKTVWKNLAEVCKLNNVREIVPLPLYIQYCLCRLSLPLYMRLVKVKKAISKK